MASHTLQEARSWRFLNGRQGDNWRRLCRIGSLSILIRVLGNDDCRLVALLLGLRRGLLLFCSFHGLAREWLRRRRRLERSERGDLFIQSLHSRLTIEMCDAVVVTRTLLHNLPPHTIVLKLPLVGFQVLKEAAESIHHVLRSSFGRVSILPRIYLFSRLEYVVELFRGRYARYGRANG